MKRLLHVHTNEKNKHEAAVKAKINTYNSLLEIVERYVTITDHKAFYSNPSGVFYSLLERKYEKLYKGVKGYKIAWLLDVNSQRIEDLEAEHLSNTVVIDPETKEEQNKPDFGVYAETESELKRLRLAETLAKAFNQNVSTTEGLKFNAHTFCIGTGNLVVVDHKQPTNVKPNWYEIKQPYSCM